MLGLERLVLTADLYKERYGAKYHTFGFYSGKITETEMFCFIANLKINFFYSTSRIFRKYNHPNGSLYNMVHLTVCCGELCLQNHSSVHWLGLCLLLGFVCLLVGA